MGHAVRVPIYVNFKAVLAPAVIAPVNRLPSFVYDYGIRTKGPSSVNVTNTPLQAAEVVEVVVAPSKDYPVPSVFYKLVLTERVDFFAAGFFFGDQAGLLDIALLDSKYKPIVAPRLDHNLASFLEVEGLDAGTYYVFAEDTRYVGAINVDPPPAPFTALLHMWQLNYKDASSASDLMVVSPNPVQVDPHGMGWLSVSFNRLSLPTPNQWPPIR